MSWVRRCGGDVVLEVRVVPRAAKTEAGKVIDGALKIRLNAPPVDGKANKALVKFLSRHLGIPAGRVTIEAGLRDRRKRIRIRTADPADVRCALT